MELFGWREFMNRREVEGLAGLTPTPYQSGGSSREQGITKSGNGHVRWMTLELAAVSAQQCHMWPCMAPGLKPWRPPPRCSHPLRDV